MCLRNKILNERREKVIINISKKGISGSKVELILPSLTIRDSITLQFVIAIFVTSYLLSL